MRHEPHRFVYFGGRTAETTLGMGGSLHHVIGEVGPAEPHSYSFTHVLARALTVATGEVEFEPETETEEDFARFAADAVYPRWRPVLPQQLLRSVRLASGMMDGPREPMEFVAKRLVDGNDRGMKVLLGTPLYVAMAE